MSGSFAESYGPWAVVVGAAQGLGAELCRQLAARHLNLVMVALEDDEQRALARQLEDQHGIETRVVVGDVSAADVQAQLGLAADGIGADVGLLVYNAGLSATEPWLATPLDRHLVPCQATFGGFTTAR